MHARRLIHVGIAVALLVPSTVVPAGAADTPAGPVCRFLGRVPAGIAWAPDGGSLAIVTSDRTTSRLEVLAYPSLERLAIHETRDLGLDHRGPTFAPDGSIYWVGFDGDDQGVWAMAPDGQVSIVVPDKPLPFGSLGALTWTDAGLVSAGSSRPMSFIVDQVLAIEPATGALARTPIMPSSTLSIAGDGTALLGIDDGSGSSLEWQLVRDGVSTTVDFGTDVLTASITPDGERLTYSSNEPEMPALQSMLPDGSDVRVEIASGVEPGVTVGPHGVLVTARYPSGMEGPALPTPPESHSWTPVPDLCFSRATWAIPDILLPDLADAVAIEPVAFVDPPLAVTKLLDAMPEQVDGHRVIYRGQSYDEAGEPIRVTDLDYALLPTTATLALGLDPDRVWADQGTIDTGGTRTSYEPEITLIADGVTDGTEWVAAARDLLRRSGDGVVTIDVALDGRDVVRVTGLPNAGTPYDGLFWPTATSYLVPVTGGMLQVATDDEANAHRIIAALGPTWTLE